jgi:hypothetical protein
MRGVILAAVIAASLAAPAPGSAATPAAWKGIVVAKDPARKALVTASAGGVVRTLRAGAAARGLRIGQRVSVQAQRLGDGTYKAQRVSPAGLATKAQLRGVLIRHQRALGRYLVSAGGSVLAVRAQSARRTASRSGDERPGTKVVMNISLTGGTLTATSIRTLGLASTIELEGIFLGLTTDGKLRLAVAHRGEVLITVPVGLTLPTLAPGDELSLDVSVDLAGAFTLVRLGDFETAVGTDENGADDQGENDQGDDQGDNDQGDDEQGDEGDDGAADDGD